MNTLDHAINLYREDEQVKQLKIDYALAEDRSEKQAIQLTLLDLGYHVKKVK